MELLLKAFPIGAKLPKSYYETKKSMKKVGLGYESIDACINDCCLFWGKDKKDEEIFPTCKASRWKNKDTTGKKVPNKVFRYFPLIPRLKRMYGSLHIAKHMTWHATGKCTEDGKMGHPVDGKAWKEFDKNNLEFTKEHRNVRLGLDADGFNPFGNLSQSYSMWPVILTTYNTPPWICMKESSFMFTCLIPGPKSPGKDMDVYLRPLTISDFPAHSSLSSWSGQGYLACPTCNEETPSTRVNGKTTYVGHKRFLPTKHHWRNDKTFNEAILGGPVYMLWMYPFERYMKKLKTYVRNKARPEDINDDGPPPTSELEVFRSACTPKSMGVGIKLDHKVKKKLVWHVLDNSPEIKEYKTECRLSMPKNDLPTKFSLWFRDKVVQEVNHQKIWDKNVILDADVDHDSNSSDVALTTNLDDLEYTQLSGAGPSTEVSFIPISRVNDDDFIDDDVKYDDVHVLSNDSEDEDSGDMKFELFLQLCLVVRIMLKTVKNQSKPGNIRHKIRSLHQKPDQRAFFYNNQANEAKMSKDSKFKDYSCYFLKITMEELLQAPTEGYGEAIVIPEILAENFEIKTNLLQLVQANKFHGRENDNPHTHISNFKRMAATFKYMDVPNDAIKLMLFSYSLEDRASVTPPKI
nr:hypothetical protein [Tanacetum cinerariifolium]